MVETEAKSTTTSNTTTLTSAAAIAAAAAAASEHIDENQRNSHQDQQSDFFAKLTSIASSLFSLRRRRERQQQQQRRRRTKREKEHTLILTTTKKTTVPTRTLPFGLSIINATNQQQQNMTEQNNKTFHMFPKLTDDLKFFIISFVADAPFELFGNDHRNQHLNYNGSRRSPNHIDNNGYDINKIGTWQASLTHTLPYVNKQFYSFCMQHDTYWQAALCRMIQTKESLLWQYAVKQIYPSLQHHGRQQNNTTPGNECHHTHDANIDWMDCISQLISTDESNVNSNHNNTTATTTISTTDNIRPRTFHQLYKIIINEQLRHVGPVFCMPANVKIGQPYGLHFFEPRYRLLIADVLRHVPNEYKDGRKSLLEGNYKVTFIHANNTPIEANQALASIVQILRCEIYPDGRADVLLLPIQYVWIEHLWIRPNSGNLVYGQGRKLGENELMAIRQ